MSAPSAIQENEQGGEVSEVFAEIQRELGIPFVPNIGKTLAHSPTALKGYWAVFNQVFLKTSLPNSVAAMILYSIASANNCNYCGSIHKVTCRAVGIDEDTLSALDSNLAALAPKRVQAIVSFARKCAMNPQSLVDDDYQTVRDLGIGDDEIVEIISLAALGNYLDTIADSLKLNVDEAISEALQR
jgi:uncharacterized peroxidase-related enzyme